MANYAFTGVDQILVVLRGLFFPTVDGVPVLGRMSSIRAIVVSALIMTAAYHLAHTLVDWVKYKRIVDRHLVEIVKVVLFGAMMTVLSPWCKDMGKQFKGIDTGTVAGVSYHSIAANIESGKDGAVRCLGAVDIVGSYQQVLYDANTARRNQILEKMKADPAYSKAIQINEQYATGAKREGFLDRVTDIYAKFRMLGGLTSQLVKQAWDKGSLGALVEMPIEAMVKAISNSLVYLFFMAATWLAYGFFALTIVKALLIFAFYLKISVYLALILLPPCVGMAYYLPLRGIAIQMVRHLVVLMILATAYGACYKTLFSQDNIRTAMAMAMKDQLSKSRNSPITDSDIMIMQTDLWFANNSKKGVNREDDWMFFSTMDPSMIKASATAVGRVVMALGMLAMLLGRLYEMISGALEGSYDPTDLMRQQANEAAEAAKK